MCIYIILRKSDSCSNQINRKFGLFDRKSIIILHNYFILMLIAFGKTKAKMVK